MANPWSVNSLPFALVLIKDEMIERFPPKLAFVEGKQRLFNERSYLVGIVVGEFQSNGRAEATAYFQPFR
tara:strand:+ start:2272 stop:2481 length:210 start_codon:yes stop_codon:yes gene_type:complete